MTGRRTHGGLGVWWRCVMNSPVVRLLAFAIVVVISTGGTHAAAQAVESTDRDVQQRLERIRGDLFERPERVKESVRELKDILAKNPQSAEGHLLLGIAYRTLGSSELMAEATAELRQALELNPRFVHAHYYLAHIYLDLGRAQRAREELETALKDAPNQPQFLALLGETERQLGNRERALEITRQALKADPSFAQARYYLARTLLDLKRRDEAIRELEDVARSGARVADVYLWLGTAYLDAGRVEMAINSLQEAARIDPSHSDIHVRLARAYRSKGLLDEADEQLTLAQPKDTAIQPTAEYQQLQSELYLEQGLIKIQRRRLTGAIEDFQKSLNIDPQNGRTHRALAEAYLSQGSYALALEHATRAEKLGFPLPAVKRKLLQEKTHPKAPRP